MSRGERIAITRGDAVARMFGMLCAVPVPHSGAPGDAGQRAIEYRLDNSGLLGGYDPGLGEPWSWSYGGRTPTTDCVGAVFGALNLDRRLMPWAFPEYSGDCNCDSMITHATNTRRVFRLLEETEFPIAGDIAVSPSTFTITGRKSGHMELVIRPKTKYNPLPITCGNSPRHKPLGQGVGVGTPWNSKVVYVRYLGFENDDAWRSPAGKNYPKYTGKKDA